MTDVFDTALDTIMETMATAAARQVLSISYNGTDITAIVDYGENLSGGAGDGAKRAACRIEVKCTDVAAPEIYDTVVIDSTTWKVMNIEEGDGYTWVLNLYTDEAPVI